MNKKTDLSKYKLFGKFSILQIMVIVGISALVVTFVLQH